MQARKRSIERLWMIATTVRWSDSKIELTKKSKSFNQTLRANATACIAFCRAVCNLVKAGFEELANEYARGVAVLNEAFKKAAETNLKGYLQVESDPIVSMDILGNTHSAILDEALTSTKGNMIKVVAWYDNESGYANRLMDLARKISSY
jgi:hypothetical protein